MTDRSVAFFNVEQPRDAHGRFGSGGGTSGTTEVGITSARTGSEFKPSAKVFADMKRFGGDLQRLPGVSDVTVQPGVGAWQGGHEPTWVVSYKGNGAAEKLLAETGKRYNQDAVLVMHGGANQANGSPSVQLSFVRPVSSSVRDAVGGVLTAHGIGGWTWFKSGGQTVLRAVAVPQWGATTQGHLDAMKAVSTALSQRGLAHASATHYVHVGVMERSGANSYDSVLKRK